MKTIGLIGGMSWESTASYYRLINEGVKENLGGLHSAKIVMVSVDFAEIESLQMRGEWSKAGQILSQAAVSLQSAGADFFLICTNTMHIVADQVAGAVHIPLLHIADATAEVLLKEGVSKVGLLGTAFTMEQSFYKGRLTDRFGLEVVVPSNEGRKVVHDVIYNELCLGVIEPASRTAYIREVEQLQEKGAQAVILGCTEISLLVAQADSSLPLIDTTSVHAQEAVRLALD
ncbi:aspartate/glutamate racemase family protein [Arenicella sp. 4NH20-0111]|uniref:aspartate/glutamate racemase family protein n=1 Tax=Arenicella sp. 4NH20-0111 TaxID=3127648 RepID=UPI00310C3A36